jgi:hypothetical protein
MLRKLLRRWLGVERDCELLQGRIDVLEQRFNKHTGTSGSLFGVEIITDAGMPKDQILFTNIKVPGGFQ